MDRRRARLRAAEDAANLRAGVIAAAVLNSVGGKKSGGSFQASDFFHFEARRVPSQRRDPNTPLSAEEQAAVEQGWLNWATSAQRVAVRRAVVAAQ